MIKIHHFVFNDFQENTYVVWDETLECIIVDPGCYHAQECSMLSSFITANKLKPVKLLNTHCHIDHILGNRFVAETYKLPLHMHEQELITYRETSRWAAMFNMPVSEPVADRVYINEGDIIRFGNTELQIALTPGHSIASLTFYNVDEKVALAGDVLFHESIGRTDLPGGSFETLIRSIREKLFVLPDDMRVYPGHGPDTTIGHEKRNNPFLNR